ncbi:hypothetical protein V8E36_000907 [Tilletia maclaganii]
MSSAEPSSSSASRTGSARFTFRDAVRSVQAAFGSPNAGNEQEGGGYEPFPSQLQLDASDGADHVHDDGQARGSHDVVPYHFPRISDAQLERLFALPDSPSGSSAAGPAALEKVVLRRREVARAALDEMELNWKLDPRALGERSDFNQGCATLVALLARVRVRNKDDFDPLDYSPAGDATTLEAQRRRLANSSLESQTGQKKKDASQHAAAFVRHWEAHDVLKAIDQQDHETILLIRDQAMDLLLDLSSASSSASSAGGGSRAGAGGGSASLRTPLGYSISLGPKWDSTSIIICGALSKFVNSLPDGDEDLDIASTSANTGTGSTQPKRKRGHKMQLDPRTMTRLRKLKTNLKLAIDSSLFKDQTSLLSSYMQVLIMAEGVGWVKDSTESVQRALESHIRGVGSADGTLPSNPVNVANDCVMQFITVNLRSKKERASSVNDYIANAVGDLILNALWQMNLLKPSEISPEAKDSLNPDLWTPIPAYVFARDERVTQHFIDRTTALRRALDEARLVADEKEGKRQSRARALSTSSRKSLKAIRAGAKLEEGQEDDDDDDESAQQQQGAPQRTIQLARNRNLRFLRIGEQMADELGKAFRTRSEQRLELIRQVLKL